MSKVKKIDTDVVKKITDKQLETVKKHQQDLNKSLTNIGFIETQKHSLLHEYTGLVEDIESYKKELEEQYGAININIEDGTYTDIEKEK